MKKIPVMFANGEMTRAQFLEPQRVLKERIHLAENNHSRESGALALLAGRGESEWSRGAIR